MARRGSSTQELLEATGTTVTGQRDEFPDVGFYLLEINGDAQGSWAILIADGSENFGALTGGDAQALSSDGAETLYFSCSDTTMTTELSCYRAGRRIWGIDYDPDEGCVEFEGAMPQVAEQIRADLEARQDAADEANDSADHIYELTAEVGRALTGFRHDRTLDCAESTPFQVLSLD
ncbi:MAG TPA: hypothetical protein VM686_15575 [Polyangiaceae bacterium]|jgi:hypothetical protein|nr:hypothetical protein [Polyangiaceae bacterium]